MFIALIVLKLFWIELSWAKVFYLPPLVSIAGVIIIALPYVVLLGLLKFLQQ